MSLAALAEPRPDLAPRALTQEQVRLVRASFARIEPAIELVAHLFRRRLLEIAPEVKPFFAGDPAEYTRQLALALHLAVASLDRLDEVAPALRLLGLKQRQAGIEASHYGAGGEALLWTLRHCLKEHFTPGVHDAWTALYTLLAETMYASGHAPPAWA